MGGGQTKWNILCNKSSSIKLDNLEFAFVLLRKALHFS